MRTQDSGCEEPSAGGRGSRRITTEITGAETRPRRGRKRACSQVSRSEKAGPVHPRTSIRIQPRRRRERCRRWDKRAFASRRTRKDRLCKYQRPPSVQNQRLALPVRAGHTAKTQASRCPGRGGARGRHLKDRDQLTATQGSSCWASGIRLELLGLRPSGQAPGSVVHPPWSAGPRGAPPGPQEDGETGSNEGRRRDWISGDSETKNKNETK